MRINTDPRKRIQGLQAHVQGERFENRLGMAFDLYRASSLADIRKTPEPMHPVKSLGGGKFVAYFEQKAQADYAGVLKGGRAVALEAEFTGCCTSARIRCWGWRIKLMIDRINWPPCPRCAPRCMECEHFTTRHGCGNCDSAKSNFKQHGQPRYRFCPDCGRPMGEEGWQELENRIGGMTDGR